MALSDIEFCRPVPDDDPLFRGMPAGSTLEADDVLYVRKGDWLPFLEAVFSACSIKKEGGLDGRPHA